MTKLCRAGDLAQARALATAGLAESTGRERGQLLAALAEVHAAAGERAPAVLACEEALGLLSGEPAAERAGLWLALGRARLGLGDPDGATDAFAEAKALASAEDGLARQAVAGLGLAAAAGERLAEATEALVQARGLAGEIPSAWELELELGRVAERAGRGLEALAHFKEARTHGWDGVSGLGDGLGAVEGGGADLDAVPAALDAGGLAQELEQLLGALAPEDAIRLGALAGSWLGQVEPEQAATVLLQRALRLADATRGQLFRSQRVGLEWTFQLWQSASRDGERTPFQDPGGEPAARAALEAGELVQEGARWALPLALPKGPSLGAVVLSGAPDPSARNAAALTALGRIGALTLGRAFSAARLRDAYVSTRRSYEEQTGWFLGLVAKAPGMQRLLGRVDDLREQDTPVLIEGEPGSGKDLLARAIHRRSRRAGGPFVVVRSGSLPDGLVEAELVGHAAGVMPGAPQARRGAFDRARGGTLFLDEVSDMPARMQAIVLQALNTGEVLPPGAPAPLPIDCRIVCASREPLAEAVRQGRFREDLYLQLDVVRLAIPPLRQRPEDIPALAQAFLGEAGRSAADLSPQGMDALLRHEWPGNLRELRQALERASLLAGSGRIDPRHLGLERLKSGRASTVQGRASSGRNRISSSGSRRLRSTSSGSQAAARVEWNGFLLNRRQLALLDELAEKGVSTNREYVQLVNVSVPTGWRDLKDLLDKGLILAEGQGRNTVYRLTETASELLQG